MTRASAGNTRNTSPVLPLSRPAMTTTLSPFLILSFGMIIPLGASQHFRRQRDDLHEPARPQFTGYRTKDARSDRLSLTGDQYSGVAVEADRASVGAAYLLGRANDDGAVHIAFFDPTARDCLFDRYDDHVAHGRCLAFRTAQHFDALNSARPGVVGDVEIGLHLDHVAPPSGSVVSPARPGCSMSVRSASADTASAASVARRRPGASLGPLITTQHLRLEIGRLSSIRTISPVRYLLFSSCAAYFFEWVTNFL